MAIQKFHTDGQLCPDLYGRCLRWHTKTLPRVTGPNGEAFEWPDNTLWVDRHGSVRGSGGSPVEPAPEPEQPVAPRASMLREAEKLITGDRNNQYGPPTQDFQRTADLLNSLGYHREDAEGVVHDILPSDVAIIIAQVKISRIMHSRGKRDSWVDLAGYAACGYECATEEESSGT